MAAALQIWPPIFTKALDALPHSMREAIERKADASGRRLESFPHKRLQGRSEFKLRIGDYRVFYEFDTVRFTNALDQSE